MDEDQVQPSARIGVCPSCLVMGENDREQCGQGWHPLETWPPKIRWTKREAIAYLRIPPGTALCIEALTQYPEIIGHPVLGRVVVNGEEAGTFRFDTGGWRVLRFQLPAQEDPGASEIRILVDNPWIPSEVSSASDNRVLGIAVSRIWAE